MGRHKTIFGTCRLCGKKTNLTFEHIPPKSTFNKNSGYIISPISIIESIESKDPFSTNPKGIIKQGGTGNYSLCGDCNSFLGRTYVNSYTAWVYSGIQLLNSNLESPFSFVLHNIEPLKILKEILSMFISIEDEDFYKNDKELCDFVRNPTSNNLPEKYQLYIHLFNEGKIFYFPFSVVGNFKTGSIIPCSEITFPPFGYVLTINFKGEIDRLINITSFKDFPFESKANVKFENMYKLPRLLSIPLDFRTKEEIEDSLKKDSNISGY
jgi:hypothetical protein